MSKQSIDHPVLFVKPKAISVSDKARLQAAGILVVETKTPREMKFVRAGVELSDTEMMAAAAAAIAQSDLATKEFGRAVCAVFVARNEKQLTK